MTEQQQGQVPPNQARRTIKLKPLTKKVPKVMMTPEQLAQAQEAEASAASQTAQKVPVMQTNIQEQKPAAVSEPTVISPLTTQKTDADAGETVLLTSPSASAEMHFDDATRKVGKQAVQASPLPVMPSAKQTIKLRPTPVPLSTPAIASAPKVPGAPTIKLTPTPAPSMSAPPVPENLEEEIFDDKTVAMSRPQRTAVPTTMPGSLIPSASASSLNLPPTISASAPTLNLNQPSAPTPTVPTPTVSAASVVTSGSPTLKLKPKMPTVSAPVTPSAPTVAASSVAQPKSPTIKLKINTSSITQSSPAAPSVPPPPQAPPPSASTIPEELTPTVPTLKLKPPGSQTLPPSVTAPAAAVDMTKSKLHLKKTPPPPEMKEGELAPAHASTYSEEQAKEAAAAAGTPVPEETAAPVVSGREEPAMIFSIAAILAFCAISFMVYMVSWQYYLQWIKPGFPVTMSAVTPKAAPKASAVAAPANADKKDAQPADKKDQPAAAKTAEKAPAKPAEKPAAKPAEKAAAPAADKKPDAKK